MCFYAIFDLLGITGNRWHPRLEVCPCLPVHLHTSSFAGIYKCMYTHNQDIQLHYCHHDRPYSHHVLSLLEWRFSSRSYAAFCFLLTSSPHPHTPPPFNPQLPPPPQHTHTPTKMCTHNHDMQHITLVGQTMSLIMSSIAFMQPI